MNESICIFYIEARLDEKFVMSLLHCSTILLSPRLSNILAAWTNIPKSMILSFVLCKLGHSTYPWPPPGRTGAGRADAWRLTGGPGRAPAPPSSSPGAPSPPAPRIEGTWSKYVMMFVSFKLCLLFEPIMVTMCYLEVILVLESLDLLSSSCVLLGLAPAMSLIVASCRNSLNIVISISEELNVQTHIGYMIHRCREGLIVVCSQSVLSNPVQQNSKWFFVFQVEAQLKLIFLWKFAVQHERSVTTLRRRSWDLDNAWPGRKAAELCDALIWLSRIWGAGQKYEFPETETQIVPVKYPLFMHHEGRMSLSSNMCRISSTKFLKILSD